MSDIKKWPKKLTDKVWSGDLLTKNEWSLTADELRAFYEATPTVADVDSVRTIVRQTTALGCVNRSHRKFDRAVQLLKREGLIKYDRALKTWVRT